MPPPRIMTGGCAPGVQRWSTSAASGKIWAFAIPNLIAQRRKTRSPLRWARPWRLNISHSILDIEIIRQMKDIGGVIEVRGPLSACQLAEGTAPLLSIGCAGSYVNAEKGTADG